MPEVCNACGAGYNGRDHDDCPYCGSTSLDDFGGDAST